MGLAGCRGVADEAIGGLKRQPLRQFAVVLDLDLIGIEYSTGAARRQGSSGARDDAADLTRPGCGVGHTVAVARFREGRRSDALDVITLGHKFQGALEYGRPIKAQPGRNTAAVSNAAAVGGVVSIRANSDVELGAGSQGVSDKDPASRIVVGDVETPNAAAVAGALICAVGSQLPSRGKV